MKITQKIKIYYNAVKFVFLIYYYDYKDKFMNKMKKEDQNGSK